MDLVAYNAQYTRMFLKSSVDMAQSWMMEEEEESQRSAERLYT